jgi:hypothetical protein
MCHSVQKHFPRRLYAKSRKSNHLIPQRLLYPVKTLLTNMPRASSTSSSHCSFDSEHVPHQYINLKYCMNALQRQEDIATTICFTNNNRTVFTEILLLDHLFQSIRQTE